MTQSEIWVTLTSGVMAFMATTLDDLLLLTRFFSQVNAVTMTTIANGGDNIGMFLYLLVAIATVWGSHF